MREFSKATQRPWSLRVSRDASGDVGITAADLPNVLAETFADLRFAGERSKVEAAANAALIIHAVNTYEERERLLEEAVERLRDACVHLIAAHSLLSSGGKNMVASDKMFEQILKDYEASADRASNFLAKLEARRA